MKRTILVVTFALLLTLALWPAGAAARTLWVCDVPGEPEPVTFVSASDAALSGINKANEKAGAVFGTQFGESCSVQSG
jgi:hypothetical protein